MGDIIYTFLIKHCAKKYVKIYKKDGKDAAGLWWQSFPWTPDAESMKKLNKEICKLEGRKYVDPDDNNPEAG